MYVCAGSTSPSWSCGGPDLEHPLARRDDRAGRSSRGRTRAGCTRARGRPRVRWRAAARPRRARAPRSASAFGHGERAARAREPVRPTLGRDNRRNDSHRARRLSRSAGGRPARPDTAGAVTETRRAACAPTRRLPPKRRSRGPRQPLEQLSSRNASERRRYASVTTDTPLPTSVVRVVPPGRCGSSRCRRPARSSTAWTASRRASSNSGHAASLPAPCNEAAVQVLGALMRAAMRPASARIERDRRARVPRPSRERREAVRHLSAYAKIGRASELPSSGVQVSRIRSRNLSR